jgi:hypothetical protein
VGVDLSNLQRVVLFFRASCSHSLVVGRLLQGTFDIMSQKERVVRFSEETRRRDRDSLFYAPPGGESLVHVLSRVDGVLTNFNRQCANRRCIVVCHGEVMWAFRLRFERLSQLTYREMEAASSPQERIHNAQILWYSRRNPHTGEISKFFKWKRSVCPWDLKRSKNEWEEIVRVEHTNDSLLQHVNRVKRIYGHEKSARAVKQQELNVGTGIPPVILTPAPPLPLQQGSDPQIAAELQSLKVDMPLMAAKAAEFSEESDPSLDMPPQPSTFTRATDSSMDPSSEDAHLPLGRVPPVSNGGPSSASQAAVAATSELLVPAPAPVWTPAPGWPFLSAHPRVLVLTKTPRYEHEKNSTGLKGQDLHAELSKLGFVSDRLVQSYVRHMEGLGQLTQALQQASMKVTVKHVDSATHADLENIDLILSAGGDGTMLKAAALLGHHSANPAAPGAERSRGMLPHTDNSTDDSHVPLHIAVPNAADAGESDSAVRPYIPIPLIGVNTDPQHSSGVLCAFSIEGPHTAERVIEHLRKVRG